MSPIWLSLALLSTAISAVVNSMDSHFLNRRMPGLKPYLLIIGIFTVIAGLILMVAFPLPVGVSVRPLTAAVFSALVRVTAVFLLLAAMKAEDVSRIIPLNSTAPIFTAVLAALFLDEELNSVQWLAIGIVVGGSVLISFKKTETGDHRFHARSFFMVIGSAALFAVGDVTNKYALETIPFISTAGLMFVITSAVFVAVCLRPVVVRQVTALPRRTATIAAVLANQVAAMCATMLGYWVIENGPVSLASTIFNSKPLFVFAFALLMAFLAPGFLPDGDWDAKTLARKLIATLMIFSGLVLIVVG